MLLAEINSGGLKCPAEISSVNQRRAVAGDYSLRNKKKTTKQYKCATSTEPHSGSSVRDGHHHWDRPSETHREGSNPFTKIVGTLCVGETHSKPRV